MRIVVIGATGNVGTALLRRLQAAPEVDSVVGISRHGPERPGEERAKSGKAPHPLGHHGVRLRTNS